MRTKNSEGKRGTVLKMKSWGNHVTRVWFSGLRTVNEALFHSWRSVITPYWKPHSPSESRDEYPLIRFLAALNVKAFPKFRMTTDSCFAFPGEPCSGRCRGLTFLPLRLILKPCVKKKKRQETVENWEKERVGGRRADACDLCLEQRGISAADNLIRLKA